MSLWREPGQRLCPSQRQEADRARLQELERKVAALHLPGHRCHFGAAVCLREVPRGADVRPSLLRGRPVWGHHFTWTCVWPAEDLTVLVVDSSGGKGNLALDE